MAGRCGFYGKLPAVGDFVKKGLPAGFIHAVDDWLSQGLAVSRDRLGAGWTEVYLTSPIWRFVCDGGFLGDAPIAGVLIPSTDKVGRYFPMIVAAALEAEANPLDLMTASWFFDAAEDAALFCLEDGVDLAAFEAKALAVTAPSAAPPVLEKSIAGGRAFAAPGARDPSAAALIALAEAGLAGIATPRGCLWTRGSDRVDETFLTLSGPPAPTLFAGLLDGTWN